ncbi:MAG: hypothetical protein AAF809_00150 [Bacteroidota bacterium]
MPAASSTLTAKPTSFFSWSYRLYDGDREVALLDHSAFLEQADIKIEGIPFRLDRDGLAGAFTLAFEGVVVAQATKRSVFSNVFDVMLGDLDPNDDRAPAAFVLQRASLSSNRFIVYSATGDAIGSIRRTSVWTRKARVDLPATIPLGVRVFLFWLAVLMWRRSNRGS